MANVATVPLVEMRNVHKAFGGTIAVGGVSLSLARGEVLALLGENGAGKSTLMKILFGLYQRDGGKVVIDGHPMPSLYSPKTAMNLGISMVHQHFRQIESFPVAENIVLGAERKFCRAVYDRTKAREELKKLYDFTGISLPSNALIRDLPLGERQKVEILKALYRGCKVLVMDEPTTVLTPQETVSLFSLIRRLRDQGMGIILITHKLHEVLEVSDRVEVLRLGRQVASFRTKETDAEELARTMVGFDLETATVKPEPCDSLSPALEFKDVATEESAGCNLKGINLKIYPGRIVGIAGVDGNGQHELVEVLAGLMPVTCGTIIDENGAPVSGRGKDIGIIPEDRQKQGLVPPLTIQDNIMLGFREEEEFVSHHLFRMDRIASFADRMIEQYDIRPRTRKEVVQFMSGGNQQKVVLARELSGKNLRFVVASQPTRGLDVGAIQFTHSKILSLRNEGKAVLLISSDLDEIRALSDEIAVIYDGRIVVQRYAPNLTRIELGLYMGGGKGEENYG